MVLIFSFAQGVNNVPEGAEMLGQAGGLLDQERQVW